MCNLSKGVEEKGIESSFTIWIKRDWSYFLEDNVHQNAVAHNNGKLIRNLRLFIWGKEERKKFLNGK